MGLRRFYLRKAYKPSGVAKHFPEIANQAMYSRALQTLAASASNILDDVHHKLYLV